MLMNMTDSYRFGKSVGSDTIGVREVVMRCDECETALYEAGEIVPAGNYVRVDDRSFRRVALARRGSLPPSFDGHIALYRSAAAPCACERRHAATIALAPARAKRPKERMNGL